MAERATTKHDIQRDEVNKTRPNYAAVNRIQVSGSISMTQDGVDTGTGQVLLYVPKDGWVNDIGNWTFVSADSPSFKVTVDQNVTGTIGVGMKIQLSHLSSTKNFFVTQQSGVTGSTTWLTLYGGTDYTLTTGSITNPRYSVDKAPYGFPLDPTKWTVIATDSADRTQASPVAGTWYNLGAFSMNIPIGTWRVSYIAVSYATRAASGILNLFTTLSTANNSESTNAHTRNFYTASVTDVTQPMHVDNIVLSLAAKTQYFLNLKTTAATVASINTLGASSGLTTIKAECAFL